MIDKISYLQTEYWESLCHKEKTWRYGDVRADRQRYRRFKQRPALYEEFLVAFPYKSVHVTYIAADARYRGHIDRNHAVVSPPGISVQWELRTGTDAIGILIRPEFVRYIGTSVLKMPPERIVMASRLGVRDDRLLRYAELLVDESNAEIARRLNEALVSHLLLHYSASPSSAPYAKWILDPVIREAVGYIHKNLGSLDLTVESLAEKYQMRDQFSRLFSQQVGKGANKYINEQRVEWAKQLLVETDDKIAAIAARVGFSSSHYFSRVFGEIAKCSPKEFREREQKSPTRMAKACIYQG